MNKKIAFFLAAIIVIAVSVVIISQIKEDKTEEILVVNHIYYNDSEKRDHDGNPVIDDEMINKIAKVDGVGKIYPLIELRSYSLNRNNSVLENTVKVETEKESYKVKFSLEEGQLPTYYVILPYYDEQKLEDKLAKKYKSSSGIYVSHEMAKILGLTNKNNKDVSLNLSIGVPIKKYVNVLVDKTKPVLSDVDIVEFESLNLKISGILNTDYQNNFTTGGDRIIYVPYEKISQLIRDELRAHKDDDFSNYGNFKIIDWAPSACVVYTKPQYDVNRIRQKLEEIDSHLQAE